MKTILIAILSVSIFLFGVFSGSFNKTTLINAKVDRILLKKSERRLFLMTGGKVVKSYKVALGRNPVGPKQQEGDHKTPEGTYVIDKHNPASSFHRSLHISYPSEADREYAQRSGVRPGGEIMIHGIKKVWAG